MFNTSFTLFIDFLRKATAMARIWTLLTAVLFTSSGVASADDTVMYYHSDAIGSVRMVTDANGGVLYRYDYLTFGVSCSTPPCVSHQPDTRQFAGKDRDSDTSFDYFGARYYASQTGRFTTVDPALNVEAALTDPQRWNRYAYALNNPLKFVDPDGREPAITNRQLDFELPKWGYAVLGTAAVVGAGVLAGPATWRAAVGCFLSPSCQSSAIEILEGAAGGPPRITPTGDIDSAAMALAQRLGGRASVAIEGFGNREFDVVSDAFIGQTFGGTSALLKPGNFLSGDRKAQIRATLEAAKATGRKAYFEFRNGVHDDVLDFIRRNAERIGAEFDVYQ